jgi:cyclopropane-fatty-acyl-phospholipid synthase
MDTLIMPSKVPALEELKQNPFDRICRRIFLKLLNKIDEGQIVLDEGGRQHRFGNPRDGLQARIQVRHPRFYAKAVWGGSVGAAEAYMAGLWTTDDLTNTLRIVIHNQKVFEDMDMGWTYLMAPIHGLYHTLNRNTRSGSRQNIVAHYDLGNDFYQLFLDETMTYSSGIFEGEQSSLEEAAIAKYDRICRKLKLSAEDHVLEIGTGWGGFAIHAVQNYGVYVTTTTISDQQFNHARRRFVKAGITDRIRLLKKDYRDLTGQYDKLVSIEMIEAVGHQYLSTFFECCSRLLKNDGLMALQAITITDQAYDQHTRSVDFIKRYIFPGSCLTSITAISDALTKHTDMNLVHLEDITSHYAHTLREWRKRFLANIDAVRSLGYSDAFIRMWHYYLSYCEAGFTERYIGDVQMLLAKPRYQNLVYPD